MKCAWDHRFIMWELSGKALILTAFTTVVLLASVPQVRCRIRPFIRYWYAENIAKGPSQFIHALHLRQGQHALRLGTNEYSIRDPKLVQQIYFDAEFVKSYQYQAFDTDGHETLLSTRDSKEHDRRLDAVEHIFQRYHVSKTEPLMKEIILQSVTQIDTPKEVDVLAFSRALALQAVSTHTLGKSYRSNRSLEQNLDSNCGPLFDYINIRSRTFGRSRTYVVNITDKDTTQASIDS